MIQPNTFKPCNDCGCKTACIPPYLARLNDYFAAEIQNIGWYQTYGSNKIVNPTFLNLTSWVQDNELSGTVSWTWNGVGANVVLQTLEKSLELNQVIDLVDTDTFSFYHDEIPADVTLQLLGWTGSVWDFLDTYTGLVPAGTETIVLTAGYSKVGFVASNDSENVVSLIIKDANLQSKTVDNYKVSTFQVIDCCTDAVVANLDSSDITYYNTDDVLQIKFRWSKYASLGNQLKVCYNRELVVNGDFTDDVLDWIQVYQEGETTGAAFTYSSGKALVSFATYDLSKVLEQLIWFEKGCDYEISINTDDNTAKVTPNVIFTIQTDDLSLNEQFRPIGNTDTFLFTPEYTGYQYLRVFANETSVDTGISAWINDISMNVRLCGNCYDINTHDCSLLIEATNNQDSYGLLAEFFGTMRVEGKMHKTTPDSKENVYRNSIGSYSNPMTNIAFITELETFLLHTDQIQALIVLLSFDNLQIDKQYYVKKESNIEIQWEEKHELGMFKCELYLKSQFLEKVSI